MGHGNRSMGGGSTRHRALTEETLRLTSVSCPPWTYTERYGVTA